MSAHPAITGNIRQVSPCEPAFSDIAHALRGRLATIRSYTEILLEVPPDDIAECRRFLRIVLDETDCVTALLADLTLLESGTESPDGVAAAADVVESAIATCQGLAVNRRIQLVVDAASVASAQVSGRAVEWIRVLTEVVDNAIKFGRDGSVVRIQALAQPTTATSVATTAHRITIRVDDEGPGVAPELREQIFAPFFQAEPAVDPLCARGDGLGLTIARSIARRYGGDVRLLPSTLGASFIIELPVAVPPVAVDHVST